MRLAHEPRVDDNRVGRLEGVFLVVDIDRLLGQAQRAHPAARHRVPVEVIAERKRVITDLHIQARIQDYLARRRVDRLRNVRRRILRIHGIHNALILRCQIEAADKVRGMFPQRP